MIAILKYNCMIIWLRGLSELIGVLCAEFGSEQAAGWHFGATGINLKHSV